MAKKKAANEKANVKRRRAGDDVQTVAAAALEREPCLCGCGGFPKGPKSRFIPGHDARYHAAQKKAQAAR